jgi:hypothetical protein
MTTRSDPPAGAIRYEQWLLNRIGLNPYHELEQRARAAERHWAATADLDPGPGMREAEAG